MVYVPQTTDTKGSADALVALAADAQYKGNNRTGIGRVGRPSSQTRAVFASALERASMSKASFLLHGMYGLSGFFIQLTARTKDLRLGHLANCPPGRGPLQKRCAARQRESAGPCPARPSRSYPRIGATDNDGDFGYLAVGYRPNELCTVLDDASLLGLRS